MKSGGEIQPKYVSLGIIGLMRNHGDFGFYPDDWKRKMTRTIVARVLILGIGRS